MITRKRIFIGLIGLSAVLLFAVMVFFAYLYFSGNRVADAIVVALAVSGLFFLSYLVFGVMALVFGSAGKRLTSFAVKPVRFVVNTLFPIAIVLGKILSIDKAVIQRSFIEVNNKIFNAGGYTCEGDKILILAPHCLQKADCPHKVTIDTSNCKRCGKCSIDRLNGLSEKYSVRVAVVTGGTAARKIVKDFRPVAVIAVACEHDLTEGIQDTFPMPVFGILNDRPNGPCFNTTVDTDRIEESIRKITSS